MKYFSVITSLAILAYMASACGSKDSRQAGASQAGGAVAASGSETARAAAPSINIDRGIVYSLPTQEAEYQEGRSHLARMFDTVLGCEVFYYYQLRRHYDHMGEQESLTVEYHHSLDGQEWHTQEVSFSNSGAARLQHINEEIMECGSACDACRAVFFAARDSEKDVADGVAEKAGGKYLLESNGRAFEADAPAGPFDYVGDFECGAGFTDSDGTNYRYSVAVEPGQEKSKIVVERLAYDAAAHRVVVRQKNVLMSPAEMDNLSADAGRTDRVKISGISVAKFDGRYYFFLTDGWNEGEYGQGAGRLYYSVSASPERLEKVRLIRSSAKSLCCNSVMVNVFSIHGTEADLLLYCGVSSDNNWVWLPVALDPEDAPVLVNVTNWHLNPCKCTWGVDEGNNYVVNGDLCVRIPEFDYVMENEQSHAVPAGWKYTDEVVDARAENAEGPNTVGQKSESQNTESQKIESQKIGAPNIASVRHGLFPGLTDSKPFARGIWQKIASTPNVGVRPGSYRASASVFTSRGLRCAKMVVKASGRTFECPANLCGSPINALSQTASWHTVEQTVALDANGCTLTFYAEGDAGALFAIKDVCLVRVGD